MPSQPTPQDWSPRRSADTIDDPNLRGEDLLRRQLLTFGGGIFRNQALAGVEWVQGSDLSGLSFLGCTLTGADFSRCNLRNTSFAGSRFVVAVFVCAEAEGADFTKAIGPASDFMAANLRAAHFAGASFVHSDFRGADLRGVDFTGAVLSESRFCAANLEGAKLTDAILEDVDFTGATMPDGTLYRSTKAEKADTVATVELPVANVEKDAA